MEGQRDLPKAAGVAHRTPGQGTQQDPGGAGSRIWRLTFSKAADLPPCSAPRPHCLSLFFIVSFSAK